MKRHIITIIMYLLLAILCIWLIYGIRVFTKMEVETPVQTQESSMEELESNTETDTETEVETDGETEAESEPETEETLEYLQDGKKSHSKGSIPKWWDDIEESSSEVEEERLPEIIIVSDLHVLAKELTDGGEAYQKKITSDDGKIIDYNSEVLEACFDEVIAQNPSALVLSGDLTLEGEKLSHLELVDKLKRVQEAGIQVLAIPGNHDINNIKNAASYEGTETVPAETITPEEFAEIYGEYGYDQAISRDEYSLSYIYPLDDKNWMMMIDTNQYEPENLVSGEIRPETYQWMIEQLELAKEEDILVIPVGHHNLLQESRLYTKECVIESNASAVWLFGEYKLPIYISGHLHAQRIRKGISEPGMPKDAYGIHEIVVSSIAMPPCQYGVLTWTESGELDYQVRQVDVEAWAQEQGIQDENLLQFSTYSTQWYYQTIENQIYKKLGALPDEQKWEMAHLYADLLYKYSAGISVDKQDVRNSEGYALWERYMWGERLFEDIKGMLKDM